MTQIQPTPLDEMPRDEARLLVLADTLQLLDEEKVTLTPGTYVSFRQWPVMKEEGEVNPVPSYELQSLLPDRPPCEVCGVGALFIATVWRDNTFKIDGWQRRLTMEQLQRRLSGLFSLRELALIEAAFEGDSAQPLGERWINDPKDNAATLRDVLSPLQELAAYAAWFADEKITPLARLRAILTFFQSLAGETLPAKPPEQAGNLAHAKARVPTLL